MEPGLSPGYRHEEEEEGKEGLEEEEEEALASSIPGFVADYMSGLREGYKEPYSQQAGCIISLTLIGVALLLDLLGHTHTRTQYL